MYLLCDDVTQNKAQRLGVQKQNFRVSVILASISLKATPYVVNREQLFDFRQSSCLCREKKTYTFG